MIKSKIMRLAGLVECMGMISVFSNIAGKTKGAEPFRMSTGIWEDIIKMYFVRNSGFGELL